MKIIFSALLIFAAVIVSAHPHVWIDSVLRFEGDRIHAVWTFDDMFSNVILSDFDIDNDKRLVGMEMDRVKEGMFDNLQNFAYFMRVYCGDVPLDVVGAENFNAEVKDGRVIYNFTVMLGGKCDDVVELYNFDSTRYSAIDVISVNGSTDLKQAEDGIRYAVIR